MSTHAAILPNQLALFSTQEWPHDGIGISRKAREVTPYLRRTYRVFTGQPPSLSRCANPVTTPFQGMELPPADMGKVASPKPNRTIVRARHKPIAVNRDTLMHEGHRIRILLRNLLPSRKSVGVTMEALRLQAYYGKCYASAKYIAENARVKGSVRTWQRVLALLRNNGLATTERLVTRFGRLSVNLLDLSELWRLLVFLLCTRSPFLTDGPGCWVASRADGVLRVPDEHGWLERPQALLAQMTDSMLTREGLAYYIGKLTKPPSWTQPWFAEWAAGMKADGVRFRFPTVRKEAMRMAG